MRGSLRIAVWVIPAVSLSFAGAEASPRRTYPLPTRPAAVGETVPGRSAEGIALELSAPPAPDDRWALLERWAESEGTPGALLDRAGLSGSSGSRGIRLAALPPTSIIPAPGAAVLKPSARNTAVVLSLQSGPSADFRIPEPASFLLIASGAAGVLAWRRGRGRPARVG